MDYLRETLIRFTGGTLIEHPEIKSMANMLPVEKNLQNIIFENKIFCLIGKFSSAYGNRKALEEIIETKNAKC